MTPEEVIEILKKHNQWRRGGEEDLISPKVIGQAIDAAISHLGQNADLKNELEEFKALVKEMRKFQGYSTFYPKRVEIEQKVDKILGL